MTPSRLLIGLLQPLLALLLLAGVPLPGGGHAPDARVAAVESIAKGYALGRERLGATELGVPDDTAGGDDHRAGDPPLATAVAAADAAFAQVPDRPRRPAAPARPARVPAAPPTGPPFA